MPPIAKAAERGYSRRLSEAPAVADRRGMRRALVDLRRCFRLCLPASGEGLADLGVVMKGGAVGTAGNGAGLRWPGVQG